MDNDFGIEREQEALAELDKIRDAFAGRSPSEPPEETPAVSSEDAVAAAFMASRNVKDQTEEPVFEAAEAAETAEAQPEELPAELAEETPAAETPAEEESEGSTALVPAAAAVAAATAVFSTAEIQETAEAVSEPEAMQPAGQTEVPVEKKKTQKEIKAEKKAAKAAAAAKAEEEKEAKKKKRKRKHPFLHAIFVLFMLFIVVALVGCGVAGYYVYKVIEDAPEINPGNIYNILTESSVLYDANGNILMNLYKKGEGLRSNVDYQDLPKNLKNAFIAIEDKTFWEHNGFNVVRIFGAIWNSAKSGFKTKISGTSTITQQLARNIFLASEKSERSMVRKIREAYYTVLIEHALSKEQILEAYLNTVYLGYNTNGVGAAAKSYFNKDIKDLTVVECAMLASLPQNPNKFSPLKRVSTSSIIDASAYDIISSDSNWTIYYNDSGEGRMWLVLKQMHDQGLIDDETYNVAKTETIRPYLNPGVNIETKVVTTYFSDYVVKQVMADLRKELNITYSEAYDMLYSGGLEIYSTIDPAVQTILDNVYDDPSNFPDVRNSSYYQRYDADGNILNDDRDRVMLYYWGSIFNQDGSMVLYPGEFEWKDNGALEVFKGNKLNIYVTYPASGMDVAVYIKDVYYYEGDTMYTMNGAYWNIAPRYKTKDDDGDLWISPDFFKDYPNAFIRNNDGSITLIADMIEQKPVVIQPQSATAIVENETGYIRGMIGGRGITGSFVFNRANNPRQTGSSIKPLSVYSTALQKGYQNALAGEGPVFTAAYVLDDAPGGTGGRLWPENVYKGYRGLTYLRDAVERSVNACAVNLYYQLDPLDIVANLENMGISTLLKSGDVNDLNPSALALGGQSKGISPLEMASAYSTFGNYGVHIEKSCYTKIVNKRGDVIIDRAPKQTKVYDPNVASLMLDILRTNVEGGGGVRARLYSQPAAGKTGTTSSQFDVWFCGVTPKYAAAVWIGCDSNIRLGHDSSQAASLWGTIMEQVGELDPRGEFQLKGSFVSVRTDRKTGMLPTDLTPDEDIRSEIFISGTQPKDGGDRRQIVQVCAETGYLATPLCKKIGSRLGIQRPSGISWEEMLASYALIPPIENWNEYARYEAQISVADWIHDIPGYYCPVHNPDPEIYPTSPIDNQYVFWNVDDLEPVEDENTANNTNNTNNTNNNNNTNNTNNNNNKNNTNNTNNTNTHTNTNTNTNTNTHTNTNTNTNTNPNTNTNTNTNTNAGTNTNTDTNTNAGTNTNTDTNTNAGTNTDTNTNAGTNTNSGDNTNTQPNTNTDSNTNSGENGGVDNEDPQAPTNTSGNH